MQITHHDREVVLPDEWWDEAGMEEFVPGTTAYLSDLSEYPGVCEVAIEDIGPVHRAPGVGVFNDGEEGSARERVVSILCGFRLGSLIPPVKIVEKPTDAAYRYKLTHGAHRLYCARAAGFSHVSSVTGFDWEELDRFKSPGASVSASSSSKPIRRRERPSTSPYSLPSSPV